MLFSQDIGIDLGTANTLVFVKGKGIVIREPSVVAVDVSAYPQKVVAVGDKAKQMIGRTPGSITAVRPLKDGVIADFEITSDMLKEFIKEKIDEDNFNIASHLCDAIWNDPNPSMSEWYDYDYSMGTMDIPVCLSEKADVEHLIED